MTPDALYAVLTAEATDFADRLEAATDAGALDRSVPSCPGWTVRDLAHHLGAIERWVCHAVERGDPDAPEPAPPADTGLVAWYRAGAAELLRRLDTDPETPAWTFGPHQQVGFWQRRQAHEHRLHRWDLESALGVPRPIAPGLAHDGVDEVARLLWPRQVRLGRAAAPEGALALVATDTRGRWSVGGEGTPVATLTGPAAALLLAVWHRLPPDAATLHWDGDEAVGRAILALPLAP